MHVIKSQLTLVCMICGLSTVFAAEPPEEPVLTGQELLAACENPHDENQLCMTFVIGLVATVDSMQERNPGEKLFCIDPQRVAPEDVRDKIVQWLKNNQPRQHEPAYVLASEVLNKAYPCQPSA